MTARLTPSGVRLRLHARKEGSLDWLLLPGGPGLGSESLLELADVLDVPGSIWLVDLPGDGSNVQAATSFDSWPGVVIEAAKAVPRPVFVGHSTGGMYLLSVPELESCLVGLALVSSAPNASWRAAFAEMAKANPLRADPASSSLRDVTVAAAEWSFLPSHLAIGRAMLERLPYAPAATEWSDKHFDDAYVARWWPRTLPTLIVSGAEDRIVTQSLWTENESDEFRTPNVLHRVIPNAGHFPWIENPDAVRAAFREFATACTEP